MIVQRGEQTVAAIEHDASLLAQAELVEVAATMVGFALDNERLHAEILARVEETRASGARLLGAADQAHEAFELRVLNGPDATLARVAALLAPRVGSPDVMEEVYAGLRSAVAQVRSIAHGLYPLSLIEHGLAAALDDLSGRVDVQLRVRGVPARRLPATIEITCYLAVAGAATRARDRLVVEFDLEAELVCRIEGAEGPPDELVVDRTGAVGGTIEARGDCIVLRLPLPAMLARA